MDAKLATAHRLDARGGWLGRRGRRRRAAQPRPWSGSEGEWRIANPPNALLVPEYFLEQEYQPYNLYFFDQTQQILVPDRVYVPARRADRVAAGPRPARAAPAPTLAPVTRTEFPARTELDLSVSVSADGTARGAVEPTSCCVSRRRS